MQQIKKIYLTFDVDYANYVNNGNPINEFPFIEKELFPLLQAYNIPASWFIRIDNDIKEKFGQADYLFIKYGNVIDKLRRAIHSICWHVHFYKNGKQNCNEKEILHEMDELNPLIKKYNLTVSRIGWGFMTNKIMQKLIEMGIQIDSSALPRPYYKWDLSKKDWSISTNIPYNPSLEDYRISGNNSCNLLEVPITTVPLPIKSDTEPNVKRYINPAYYHNVFKEAINKSDVSPVLICHPYEIVKIKSNNSLLAFCLHEFEKNLDYLVQNKYEFYPINENINF